MNIQKTEIQKNQQELTITITPAEYQEYLERTAIKLSKSIKIEGFRPGRAPYNIIKQKIGEGELLSEAVNEIISKTLFEAIKKENILDFVGQPGIKIEKMAPDNDLIYQATFVYLPKVTLPDFDKITVKKKEVEIEKDEITKVIKDFARSRAKETLKEKDKKAEVGDLVDLDYELSLDGATKPEQTQKNFKVNIGDKHMIPGFEEEIVGLQRGDKKEFDIKFPADYWQKDFAGKLAKFKVEINSIYKLELPEVNDEFVKNLGDFKSVKDLENKIESNLKLEKETENIRQLENEMFDEIIKKTKFDDIPEKIIHDELHAIVHEFSHVLENRGANMETWLKNMGKTEEEFEKDLQPQAEMRVKTNLVVREVAKNQNLIPDDKKLDSEIKKLEKVYQGNKEMLEHIQTPEYRDYLASGLVTQEAVKWLKEKVVK